METKEQQKDLGKITYLEAKESEWGAKASRAKNEYARKYSEFKRGDKLILTLFDNTERFGIVNHVSFDTHQGFRYQIHPKSKNWDDKVRRKAFYYFSTWHGDRFNTEVIKIRKS